jgi:hypothetical protein
MYTPPRLGCVVLIAISLSALGHQAAAQEEDVCSFAARLANQGRLAEIRLPKQEPLLAPPGSDGSNLSGAYPQRNRREIA